MTASLGVLPACNTEAGGLSRPKNHSALLPTAITEYTVVLTADSIRARSTRRRQTSTGWNNAYIGANRYTLPPDEKPPADDALHPMAFLVDIDAHQPAGA